MSRRTKRWLGGVGVLLVAGFVVLKTRQGQTPSQSAALLQSSGALLDPQRPLHHNRAVTQRVESIPELVKGLYAIVRRLEEKYPGRRFTPDGHLVGSLGEVIAAELYGLELLPASTTTHDGTAIDGRQVQIKLTQVKTVGIRSEPEHLIVLKLHPDGTTSEIYNGPGTPAWQAAGRAGSALKN